MFLEFDASRVSSFQAMHLEIKEKTVRNLVRAIILDFTDKSSSQVLILILDQSYFLDAMIGFIPFVSTGRVIARAEVERYRCRMLTSCAPAPSLSWLLHNCAGLCLALIPSFSPTTTSQRSRSTPSPTSSSFDFFLGMADPSSS